jgi:hypothetical protein
MVRGKEIDNCFFLQIARGPTVSSVYQFSYKTHTYWDLWMIFFHLPLNIFMLILIISTGTFRTEISVSRRFVRWTWIFFLCYLIMLIKFANQWFGLQHKKQFIKELSFAFLCQHFHHNDVTNSVMNKPETLHYKYWLIFTVFEIFLEYRNRRGRGGGGGVAVSARRHHSLLSYYC